MEKYPKISGTPGRPPPGSAFLRAVDDELRLAYKDIIENANRQVFVFDQLPEQDPVLGPPAPPWYERELDELLAGGSTGDVLHRSLVDLLDRVDDAGRDW